MAVACCGSARTGAPLRLELEYALRMSAWLLFHDLDTLAGKHLATLGLGAGSLTKFAHGVLGMHATAVEIDARVIAICREQFMLQPDGDRLRVVHADAATFMAHAVPLDSVDVLQVAYDASVDAPALDSEHFHADCRRRLRADATVAINLIGRAVDVRASVARLRAGLQPRCVWQFPPTDAGNVVVISHCGAVPAEEVLVARADEIERRWDLPARGWLAMARRVAG